MVGWKFCDALTVAHTLSILRMFARDSVFNGKRHDVKKNDKSEVCTS